MLNFDFLVKSICTDVRKRSFIKQTENTFFLSFHYKSDVERKQVFLKRGARDFQNSPPFEKSTCFYAFMCQSLEILNVFNILALKQVFRKTKTFVKKLEYRFSAERTKIENRTFPYKNCPVRTQCQENRMGSAKWTYHKEQSFTSDYFIFLKILFQFNNLLTKIGLTHQLPKFSYSYFSKELEFYLKSAFSL